MSPRPARATGNRSLSSAKAAKQDEFYTQLEDIANEPKHALALAGRGPVSAANSGEGADNCDDPFEGKPGESGLIATSYDGSPIAGSRILFPEYDEGNGKRQ